MIIHEKIKKEIIMAGNRILDLLYPAKCPLCHRILKEKETLICPDCAVRIRPVGEPHCKKCGRPVQKETEYCPDCQRGRSFTEGRGIFLYDECMKKSILKYKYEGRREYGSFYACTLEFYTRKERERWKPDVLIPVPMHKSKRKKRGFNQSEDLAGKLSERTGIPVAAHLVRKKYATKSQKTLGSAERKRNLAEAFEVTQPVSGLKILLIDDVFTTGSTIEALAQKLLERGAARIYFLTVCIGILQETEK